MKNYWVYFLTNKHKNVLYIGITSNLVKRIHQHKIQQCKGFTSKYNVHILVYYETYDDPLNAISREKQLKKWTRRKKDNLINTHNPGWNDLGVDLY